MPLLVSDIEAELIAVYVGFLSTSGDETDSSTPNADLRSPIASAARALGLAMANPLSLADSELAALAVGDVQKFLDVAKLYAVEQALGNFTEFDSDVDGNKQQLDQLRQAMEKELARLQKLVLDRYGIGVIASATLIGQSPADFPIPGTPTWGLGLPASCPPTWGRDRYRTDH